MTARVLIHVQHLLGIGHLKRAAAIADALVRRGARVTLASGGVPVPQIEDALAGRGVAIARLAPARTADVHFSQVLDDAGQPIDDVWKQRRRGHLLEILHATAPDALITEMFPFGRRPFRFELLPLLEAARNASNPPVVAASVRDILVSRGKPGRAQEIAALVRQRYDLVLVHSDPDLIRFEDSFADTAAIADRIRYTGFVTDAIAPAGEADRSEGEILVSVGGGAVGFPLLEAALAARPLSQESNRRWRLIAGQNMPQHEYDALSKAAAPEQGVVLERFRSDFRELLAQCRVSVSQGGYNTMLEALACRAPSVVVPFAEGAESEQTDRARLLAARGLLELVPQAGLTPNLLAAAIDRAARCKPPAMAVDLDGANRSAEIILDRIEARKQGPWR